MTYIQNIKRLVDLNFYEELVKMKGIGKETAKDIVNIYPDRESLSIALESKEKLPLRNDVEEILKKWMNSI